VARIIEFHGGQASTVCTDPVPALLGRFVFANNAVPRFVRLPEFAATP